MSFEPSAKDYLELAVEMNKLARVALRLDTRDATIPEAKISIGLSLQAAELTGKGMLRCLGYSATNIRQSYRKHEELLTLLQKVEVELSKSQQPLFQEHWDFLMWAPVIDGNEYTTIDLYLEMHFSKGASARPRSYFYPDEQVFTGPVPIQAVYLMVEHLIDTLRIFVGKHN